MRTRMFSGILFLLALGLLLPSGAPAAVVGRITQVEGQVDLLKKGQLPVTPVKLEDGLDKGDVIRTKSLSKAQITFVDKSTLTIGPESRIAIEEFMVDEGNGKRNVVLKMFQGLALAVVSKIYQSEEPNFVVKTQTAIMGIRGTQVGIRLYPNFSEFLNFQGRIRVQSNLPGIHGVVELNPMQGTRVTRGLPPSTPFTVSDEDRQQFMNQMTTGLNARTRGEDGLVGMEVRFLNPHQRFYANRGHNSSNTASISPTINSTAQPAPPMVTGNPPLPEEIKPPPRPDVPPVVDPPVVVPPIVEPPVVVPPVAQSYSPNLADMCGLYTMTSSQGHQNATYTGALSLNNSAVQYTVVAQDPAPPGDFVKSYSGTITWTVKGDLPLVSGSNNTYSGPLTVTGTTSGGTVFTFSLQATYTNGKLTFDTTGPLTGTYASISKDITPDFTSPGSSNKITPGSATITWTSTTAAASTAPLAATQITAISLPSPKVISAVNTLPTSPIFTTLTGPPGKSGAGIPGGPQGSPAASAPGPPGAAGPPGLTGNVPAVVGGGGSPVIAGATPGMSGTAPGRSGSGPPGLSVGGPPGRSGNGPPGQLKDKSK